MPIIKGYVCPYWHESHLMILILNRGSMPKQGLFDEITREQKKRTVYDEKGITHSKRAYDYWVKRRKEQRVIGERAGTLELTPLGRWIANSQLGTFSQRDDFVNLICSQCAKPGDLVLLKPLLHTAEANVKGRLFMDLECPRCRYSINRVGISEGLSKDEFIKFYNTALTELNKIVSGEPLAAQ